MVVSHRVQVLGTSYSTSSGPIGNTGTMPGIGGSTGNPPIIIGGGTTGSSGSKGGGKNLDNKLQISEPACGCKVPGGGSSRGSAALLVLALFGLSRRRRARRSPCDC